MGIYGVYEFMGLMVIYGAYGVYRVLGFRALGPWDLGLIWVETGT